MKSLQECRLYGILDMGYVPSEHVEHVTEQLCDGGVDILQLRAKYWDEEAIESIGERIAPILEKAGIPLIVNDHPEIVPTLGAAGAHVGQDDKGVSDARWRAGRALNGEVPEPLIGKSTHGLQQAIQAQADGADYIGFGPLFATPTKLGRQAIGLEEIRRVHEVVKIPIFCIGGIKLENITSVLAAGATRVVIVSGILKAPDIVAYCREVKRALEKQSNL